MHLTFLPHWHTNFIVPHFDYELRYQNPLVWGLAQNLVTSEYNLCSLRYCTFSKTNKWFYLVSQPCFSKLLHSDKMLQCELSKSILNIAQSLSLFTVVKCMLMSFNFPISTLICIPSWHMYWFLGRIFAGNIRFKDMTTFSHI